MDIIEISRFMSQVDTSGSCWMWTGALNGNGYGRGYDPRLKRTRYAHHISFEQFKGDHPQDIMHSCDNRACVNPAHLEAGSRSQNMRHMAKQARGNTVRLTPDQVLRIRDEYMPGPHGNVMELANRYNVSRHTVRQAAIRETWKDLA